MRLATILFAMAATAQAQKKCADTTRDGKVDVEDLLATLAQYNTRCTIANSNSNAREKPDKPAKTGECRDVVIGRHDGGGGNRLDDGAGLDRVHTNGGQAYCAPIWEKHELRCVSRFSLTSKGGIYKKCQGKDFFSISTKIQASNKGKATCQHGLNYNQAVKACARLGARLPTRQEVDRNCAAGGGCNHDNDLIWTSSSGLPKKSELVAKRKTCKDIGKASYNAHEFEFCVSPKERHEVRCCSSKPVKGFAKKQCGSKKVGGKNVPVFIWTESNAKAMRGCQNNKNWAQANAICRKAGARLCTLNELRKHCTMGTGCNHDHDLVWTNSNKLYLRPGLPKLVAKGKTVPRPAMGFEVGTMKLANTVAKRVVLKTRFKNPIIFLGTPSHKGGNEVVMRVKRRGWVTNDATEKQNMARRPTWFDIYMDTPNHGAKRQTARACKDFNPAGKTPAQKCPAAIKGQEKNCAKMRTMYGCVTRRVQTRRGGTVGACRLQTHTTETVSYLVVEGRMANIKTNSPKTVYRAGKLSAQNFGWKSVRFTGMKKVGKKMVPNANDPALKKAVVLSQIQSHNGADWVKTRLRKVDAVGFQVKMEETSIDKNHNREQIGWAALPVGRGRISSTMQFEAFVTPNAVTHKPYAVTFKTNFKVAPFFFSAMQTTDGGDPTHMRYQTLTNKKASFFVEEETCSDKEIAHTTEAVGVLLLGP